ncbi:YbhB/YbcL family Raf kinase inhibitor-like protein [Curvivirga aplysinae]|uniref:YbhB/YbcL family Raf kinase inhibitor-like protein n=1 Tax=Curvivirga aplysinae TaxID=2529852 RepID=UPI0012BC41D9|nr:YbhB/YbcL family Raf kinase inhibitor-like protein [Curvivirga aplysinae]MTI08624.1 YbhB/YbcL family Raf kinase inhibitor-like protein [Curvivirga aplysinae]
MLRIIYAIGFALIANTSFALDLKSKDIEEGSRIPEIHQFNGFGCSGGNISPHLSWSDVPKGTKSFAITAFDPDAPTESGFWHWSMINIPRSQTSLDRGTSIGFESKNDYGYNGYGGPCPPKGDGMHRYQFTVWALPQENLEIPVGASNAVIGYFLNQLHLEKARITGTFVTE